MMNQNFATFLAQGQQQTAAPEAAVVNQRPDNMEAKIGGIESLLGRMAAHMGV